MRTSVFLIIFSSLVPAVSAISLLSCDGPITLPGMGGDTEATISALPESSFFFSQASALVVEVAYEKGAEPFTDRTPTGMKYWDILETNLRELFFGRSIRDQITVPKDLPQMKEIQSQNRSSWPIEAILALSEQVRTERTTASKASFLILFLNGFFEKNGVENKNVIGVSIGATTIVAIFKDVIRSSSVDPLTPRYVEQATLVHEMGHALGLVNHGIAPVTPHHDAAHGAHCINDKCVMYFLNEGIGDLVNFVQDYIQSGSVVMFANECLEDARKFSP